MLRFLIGAILFSFLVSVHKLLNSLRSMKAQRIADAFRVTLFEANLALLIIRGRVNPGKFPNALKRRCPATFANVYSQFDYWTDLSHNRRNEIKFQLLDELLDTCGVEAIRTDEHIDNYHFDIRASYLNTGDTYATTLLLDHKERVWKLRSWGDFVEAIEGEEFECGGGVVGDIW